MIKYIKSIFEHSEAVKPSSMLKVGVFLPIKIVYYLLLLYTKLRSESKIAL